MKVKEFKALVETYRKNQVKQLQRLSKIHSYIDNKCPHSIDLQYFITDITAMTEPDTWSEHLITLYDEVKQDEKLD